MGMRTSGPPVPLIDEAMPVITPMTTSAPLASVRDATPDGTVPRSEFSADAMMSTAISSSSANAGTAVATVAPMNAPGVAPAASHAASFHRIEPCR